MALSALAWLRYASAGMAERVGFVGLGVMGGPMAGHLLDAGQPLTVWNRTPSKAEPLRERGARVADSLEDLGRECEVVFLCVSRTEDVRACLEGLTRTARPGTLFVDHSTIEPAAAGILQSVLKQRGFRFVDAPITGGSMGAQKGQLTVFLGGEEADVRQTLGLIGPYTRRGERVGGPGAGQTMKMANQIAVAGALLALCESLAFVEKAGLDLAQAHALIGGGAGGSWAFENYGAKILAQDWTPGFSVVNQRKDLAYCRDAALAIGAIVPGSELTDRLLAPLEEAGRGEDTTAALFDVMLGKVK